MGRRNGLGFMRIHMHKKPVTPDCTVEKKSHKSVGEQMNRWKKNRLLDCNWRTGDVLSPGEFEHFL